MKLYKIEDLKNSRIFFDKKPPAFLTVFIVSVLIILLLFLLICAILPKNYIVEAQGFITTDDNVYIGTYSDGLIIEIKKQENEWVEKDEVLITISNGNEGVQIAALNKQLEQIQQKKEAMEIFEKSLNAKINYLKNEGAQQEYYGKMEYFLSLISDVQTNIATKEKEKQKKQEKIQEKKQELSDLESELNNLNKDLESSNDMSIQSKIEELKTNIKGKKSEIEALENEIGQSNTQPSNSQIEQTRLQLISELGGSKTAIENEIVKIQSQIDIYKEQDKLIEIKASQQGYVHYLRPLKNGITLQKGQTIAEVSKNQKKQMTVEAYIQAADRSKVHIDDEVRVAIQGVNTQKYGTLFGKVVEIDNGTITQETNNGNNIFYKCKIDLSDLELSSTKGESVQIVKSMPVVARIVYNQETYAEWLLEMLNFKN